MQDWQEGDVVTNGINLHYHRTRGDKPPLVLAHGITDSGLCFLRVARALEESYDVIMVDARGHGRSDKPATSYGPTDHAADLAGLIEALELGSPGVVGHSMGASTATYLAAGWPDRVRCLVLEDPPWRSLSAEQGVDPSVREMYARRIATRQAMNLEEVIAQGRDLNPKWAGDDLPAWAEAKHQVVPQVVDYTTGGRRPWAGMIAQIRCPTLLLIGEQGVSGSDVPAIVTPEIAAAACGLNPNLQSVQIAGAAHNIRRDQFDAFMAAVRPFLDETVAKLRSD